MQFRFNFTLVVWIIGIIGLLICLRYLYKRIKHKSTLDKSKFAPNFNSSIMKKYNILSISFIMIVGLSWIMNLGWFRVIFLIPMIVHIFLFFFSNRSYHRYASESSRSMSLINSFNYGTFLFGYVLLPDFGDTEDSIRVVFGLISNEIFVGIAFYVSLLLLVTNFILIVIQIIYTRKVKRALQNKNN